MTCEGCGSEEARNLKIKFDVVSVDEKGKPTEYKKVVACDVCKGVRPEYPRDALGQKVSLPTGFSKGYSAATGTEITSARQYSEVLKKLNLGQKNV